MKPKAKVVKTPVGLFPFPMNPAFKDRLKACKTNEDLFQLIEENGFINPDAFAELQARNLVAEYADWKESNQI